jgi:type III restriction enzyme
MAAKRTAKKSAPTVTATNDRELKGQGKVISEVARLVDAWRGFPLGSAREAYPEEEPRYEPISDGEQRLSMTSHALLAHWFRHEPHVLGRSPRTFAFKYWPHQRRLVETIIYLHEVRGIRRTEELYALTGVDPLEAQRDPWAKLGGQLATGSGKTKMMSLLIAWAYLNATLEPDSALGFGRHALVIAPGLFVRDRLLQDFAPRDGSPSVFSFDPVIPPELLNAWDLRVYSPATCPLKLDPEEGALVVTNYHQLLRTRQDAPDLQHLSPEERQMEMLFEDKDPTKLEAIESPLLERFAHSSGLLVLNDEAHHVGDEPAHAQFEQKVRDRAKLTTTDAAEPVAEAMAWIRSLRRLNGSATAPGRLALQVDLSATLYAEAGASKKQGAGASENDALAFKPFDLFRHTAVRYDLKDAIPDGIVKKPILERVVVTNTTTGEIEPLVRAGQANAWEKYKNILVTGIERWKKVRRQLEDEGDTRKPIIFVLCDNRNEAKEVANYLKFGDAIAADEPERIPTGFRDSREPGAEPLFLFTDAAGEVHSTVLEIHIGEKENRSEAEWEKVRSAVNAIDHDTIPEPSGRKDGDGHPVMIANPYNVVVSVMMLKEGWDVRNVKVIVPLRPCDSRTLTEQTLGRGLRKMHAPILDDEGAATITNEELYVIEHPSFKAVLDQIRDIIEEGTGEDPPREYVPILQREDPAEREAFDVRLPRFEGLTQQQVDWRKSFDVNKLPPLKPKQPWRDEIADAEINTFLKHALENQELAGQSFTLDGATSYQDFDQVIELAYAVPLLKDLRTSYQHKNSVKEVVREFLERRTFALPAGIPLRFGGIMDPADARIALGNLARPDVINAAKEALLPALRAAIISQRSASQAQMSERRAKGLRNYQALKKNVVQALRKSTFQQVAVDSVDELKLAVLVDRATDVTGWVYNHRQGVGFSISYDWQGRISQYFPDFIVRAKLGQVFHNFIIEVKGRLDDRDKVKARAGEAHCQLLTEHDPEPWHYLMLIENEPIGREDITWWQNQSKTEMGDLLRHHESLPLVPKGGGPPSGKPFQLLLARPSEGQSNAVPVYDLAVAAGGFSPSQSPEALGWAVVKTSHTWDAALFVAQVTGHSMEDGIPDGSYCLFRAYEAGTAPHAVALDGRRVVVELREGAESDLGGRYTLKRWRVAKMETDGGVSQIELAPDNHAYRPIHLSASNGEIRVVAEFLEVLA